MHRRRPSAGSAAPPRPRVACSHGSGRRARRRVGGPVGDPMEAALDASPAGSGIDPDDERVERPPPGSRSTRVAAGCRSSTGDRGAGEGRARRGAAPLLDGRPGPAARVHELAAPGPAGAGRRPAAGRRRRARPTTPTEAESRPRAARPHRAAGPAAPRVRATPSRPAGAPGSAWRWSPATTRPRRAAIADRGRASPGRAPGPRRATTCPRTTTCSALLVDRDGVVVSRVHPRTSCASPGSLQGTRARRGHDRRRRQRRPRPAGGRHRRRHGPVRAPTSPGRPPTWSCSTTTSRTIVAAIEQGRATFANIRRFLTYHLTDNVAELTPFVVWALSGGRFPLALGVLQILALDIGTDILPAARPRGRAARARRRSTSPPVRVATSSTATAAAPGLRGARARPRPLVEMTAFVVALRRRRLAARRRRSPPAARSWRRRAPRSPPWSSARSANAFACRSTATGAALAARLDQQPPAARRRRGGAGRPARLPAAALHGRPLGHRPSRRGRPSSWRSARPRRSSRPTPCTSTVGPVVGRLGWDDPPVTSPVTGFSHVQLVVRDVPTSERWYSTVLGMDRLTAADDDSYVALRHRPSRVVVVLTAGDPGDRRPAGAARPPGLRRPRRPDPGGLGRRADRPGHRPPRRGRRAGQALPGAPGPRRQPHRAGRPTRHGADARAIEAATKGAGLVVGGAGGAGPGRRAGRTDGDQEGGGRLRRRGLRRDAGSVAFRLATSQG